MKSHFGACGAVLLEGRTANWHHSSTIGKKRSTSYKSGIITGKKRNHLRDVFRLAQSSKRMDLSAGRKRSFRVVRLRRTPAQHWRIDGTGTNTIAANPLQRIIKRDAFCETEQSML